MSSARRRGRGGFTLVEVVFAVMILTIGSLMLTIALSSSERMNSISRERAIANNAIRAYIARVRATYPLSGSSDMLPLLWPPLGNAGTPTNPVAVTDAVVPTADLFQMYASGTVERSVLKGVVARVSFGTWEDGTNFGPCFTTDATVASVDTSVAQPTGNQITADDKLALGFPMDLNASKTVTAFGGGGDTVALQKAATPQSIVTVPAKIELFWISGSARSIDANTKRQSMVVYAIFSSSH